MTGIWRRQAADIVVIIHFSPFLSFPSFLSLLSFSSPPTLNSSPLHPDHHPHSRPVAPDQVHQKRGPVAPLTPTCAQNQLPLRHLPCISINENLNQLLHGIDRALHTILNLLNMLFLSTLNVTNCLCNLP